ncbi:uncharacterized protein LAESUDRAFT_707678 [Laetiporus sulphureus 93-53]|uniref:Uncharacterized protein n=1 Tax=Laetiporus sulphureus 93-53 TaxID=1314785 RepID=A0A165BM31_9APHY|nr:uncharacterized protein LAESUDRAFT_707678 [Laetiporus sulphureus 93-53]KZT01295.1 hypothetical protein LAESUDRAFT_707678 [Laetiporus sulphureus 93-53]
MKTHQPPEEWVCCGLPAKWVLPEGVQLESVAGTYWYKDVLMIGGCMNGFSRRDSLVRHLQTGVCRGDAEVVHAINQGCGALLDSEGVQPSFGPL